MAYNIKIINQGGAVALLQRLHSIIDEQMAEASQFVTVSDAPEEKECLDGTSSHATSRIRHEGRQRSPNLKNFFKHEIKFSLEYLHMFLF